jgi:hypothetical protein
MHTSPSLTLYWCPVSRHVSGITCPSSGGITRTQIWWLLCADVDVGWSEDVGRRSQLCSVTGRIYRRVENFRMSGLLLNKNKIRKLIFFVYDAWSTLSGKVKHLSGIPYYCVKPRAVLEAVFAWTRNSEFCTKLGEPCLFAEASYDWCCRLIMIALFVQLSEER